MSMDSRDKDISEHITAPIKMDAPDLPNTDDVVAFDDNDFIEGSVGSRLSSWGRLWAFGENRYGQLGLGHSRQSCLLPTLIPYMKAFDLCSSARILGLAVGAMSSVALVCHNSRIGIISSGRSHDSDFRNLQLVFKQMNIALNESNANSLTGIAASERIFAACFQDGSIIVWGEWSGKVAGLGRIFHLQCTEERVVICDSEGLVSMIDCDLQIIRLKFPESVKIVDIACFSTSCLALADVGSVWSWEIDNLVNENFTVRRVPIASTIVQIACGKQHYLCLNSQGEVFSWSSEKDFFGTGSSSDWKRPTKITSIREHVVQVAAGAYHSVCLTKQGTVYTWGDGTFGQLGNNDTSFSSSPCPVLSLVGKNIRQITAGPNQTLAYVYCFLSPGDILQRLEESSCGISFPEDHVDDAVRVRSFSVLETENQNITERDKCSKTVINHLAYELNSRSYNLDVVLCRQTTMSHLLVHFEVEQDISFRGALNSYIRNCFEREAGKYCFVFKNLSISKPQNIQTNVIRCTLLIICKKSLLPENSLQGIPDWLSLFIEAFHPLDVNPKFVVLCPSAAWKLITDSF